MPNSKNIKVQKVRLCPKTGEHNIIPNQYVWRTEKRFVGDNVIAIMDNQEAVWWNRPAEQTDMCKLEKDGLYSYNLPYCGPDAYKTNYNILLNKNSIPCAVHIKLDSEWTPEQKTKLYQMTYYCIYQALIDLGVSEADLSRPRNDILYKGKKFVGGERVCSDEVYSEDLVITLQVLPEKEIFDRLTGQYAHRRKITGISEEIPSITKAVFMDKLSEKLSLYIQENFS